VAKREAWAETIGLAIADFQFSDSQCLFNLPIEIEDCKFAGMLDLNLWGTC